MQWHYFQISLWSEILEVKTSSYLFGVIQFNSWCHSLIFDQLLFRFYIHLIIHSWLLIFSPMYDSALILWAMHWHIIDLDKDMRKRKAAWLLEAIWVLSSRPWCSLVEHKRFHRTSTWDKATVNMMNQDKNKTTLLTMSEHRAKSSLCPNH